MKYILNSLGMFCAAVATASAATLTFEGNTTVTSDAALDVAFSKPEAVLVQAVTFGGAAQTVFTTGGQTINFTVGTAVATADMPAAPSSSTVIYNAGLQNNAALFAGTTGDAQFDAVLDSGAWHNKVSDATQPMTLRLGGLTIGQMYAVSLFSADARSTDRSQAYWDTFSGGTFSGGTSGSFSQNPATMTIATFTADATFQDIFIQETDGIQNDDTNFSGFTLYAIPEPSAALLGGLGMLALLRRRRN